MIGALLFATLVAFAAGLAVGRRRRVPRRVSLVRFGKTEATFR